MSTRSARLATAIIAALSLILYGCDNEADEVAERYQRANTFHTKGDLRATIIELKNALQIDPEHRESRWLLGQSYLALGDGNAARKEIERARSLGLRAPGLERALVLALILQGELEDALSQIRANPEAEADGEWLILEGETLLGLGRNDEARAAFTSALERGHDEPRARRGLARLAIAGGDSDDAQAQIDRALAAAATDVETLLLKGEIELSLGRREAAEASFRAVLESAPDSPGAQLGLAQILLADRRVDDAAGLVDALAKRAPRDPRVNFLKALLARQRGDLEAAQDAAREVLVAAPNHLPALLLMGQIHFLEREFVLAEEHLRRYLAGAPGSLSALKLLGAVLIEQRRLDEALQILHVVERQSPDDPQLLAMLGTAYMGKRDGERSKSYLDRASEMAPDASPIRTQLAVSHLATGDTDKAVEELAAVVESDPEFARAEVLLIVTHLRERNFDAAVDAASALAAKRDQSPEARNFLGAAREGQGDREGARAAYAEAIALRNDYSAAALNLARMDLHDGKLEAARTAYEAVLEREPNNEHALIAMAKLASDDGRAQESVALLEKARAGSARALRPRLILASYYLRQGRRDDALEVAQEAHELAPDAPGVGLLLGRAQLASGRTEEAVTTLKSVAERAPGAAAAHFQLALAQGRAGRIEETRAALERVLELDPGNLRAQLALGTVEVRSGGAARAMERAHAMQADHPEAQAGFVLEGDALLSSGNAADAVDAYEKAAALGDSTAVTLKLTAARRRAGDEAGADRDVEAWLERHPEDSAVRLSRASHDQATGQIERATREYERIIEQQPGNVIALNNLAWLYHERDDPRALDLARRAADGAPGRPEILDTYGWLLVRGGQRGRGLAMLEKALLGAPDNGDIAYHLAASLADAGDVDRARRILGPLLASETEFQERAAAAALLELIGALN